MAGFQAYTDVVVVVVEVVFVQLIVATKKPAVFDKSLEQCSSSGVQDSCTRPGSSSPLTVCCSTALNRLEQRSLARSRLAGWHRRNECTGDHRLLSGRKLSLLPLAGGYNDSARP